MDYKTLLIKYMQHLHNMEETLFLELANSPFSPKVNFTEEELASIDAFFPKGAAAGMRYPEQMMATIDR